MAKGKKTGGRQKGTKNKATLDKLAAREYYRQRVMERLDPIIEAQFASALGVYHLMAKDKDGSFTRVTDPDVMVRVLNSGESFYKIYAQNPNPQAQRDLLDRVLDKPKEQEQELKITGELELVTRRLLEARKRAAGKRDSES